MQTIFHVNAFTDRPFTGNPAGVCILEGPADEAWMQNIAAELNLPETAFLHREDSAWRLRWFSPEVEVDLCGHATLAAAHVLWETGRLGPNDRAQFLTKGGDLGAAKRGRGITLDFPELPIEQVGEPHGLLTALGVRSPVAIGRSRFDYLVEVESAQQLRALEPDYTAMRTLDVRGVIVTSLSRSAGSDFVSRFFAPAVGVNEDPVTGSAHCVLGPYWHAKLGRNPLVGYQASRRGGVVEVHMVNDRVELTGQAVTVMRCELLCG
jgi:predicted PhzF superfamily epimerase YddE/YHI9